MSRALDESRETFTRLVNRTIYTQLKVFFFLSRISIISPVSSLLGHVFSLFKIVFAWGLVNDLHLHLQSRNSRVVTASVEMNLGGMSVIYFVPAVMLYLF